MAGVGSDDIFHALRCCCMLYIPVLVGICFFIFPTHAHFSEMGSEYVDLSFKCSLGSAGI